MKRTAMKLIAAGILVAGCSGKSETEGEHVWKDQTDAVKKAEQVEDVLKESAARQRQQIDDT